MSETKTYSSINEVESDLFPSKLRERLEEFFIDYYGKSKYKSLEIKWKAMKNTGWIDNV